MKRFKYVNKTRIVYQIYNEDSKGIPLLMIMGLAATKEDWFDLPERLSKDRPVLTFDNRGIGESDIPDDFGDLSTMAKDCIQLVDEVNWKVFHVLGISMGGMIATHLALMAPTRVKKLILGCTTSRMIGSIEFAKRLRGIQQSDKTAYEKTCQLIDLNVTKAWKEANPLQYQKFVKTSLSTTRKTNGIVRQMIAAQRHNLYDRLPELECPILIIHGDEDRVIELVGNADVMHKNLKNAKLIVMKRVGHAFWIEDLELTVYYISNFLKESKL
eukprot:TRINITY_DN8566_c0_g1_i1.p1 TRINITY_DN8566_c0_g1~~TRINITY_DN8566_c0_g1_i1.p1  ORF type:complete len:271 (-),score=66.50 TRINITY_DN8566_c0_g1_i1:7-819(-)